MEHWLQLLAQYVSLALNAVAILVIAAGAVAALVAIAVAVGQRRASNGPEIRRIWLDFARWLVAGLTFQLAADIVETAVAPTWDDIGHLAAIAVIRTFLTYFLDRDMETIRERQTLPGNRTDEQERR